MQKKQTEIRCADCSAGLEKDEIALSKKMFGRNTNGFYCLNCLAIILECDVDDLKVKIQEFKEQGCMLFL